MSKSKIAILNKLELTSDEVWSLYAAYTNKDDKKVKSVIRKVNKVLGEIPKAIFNDRVGSDFDTLLLVFEFSDKELVGIDAFYSSYEDVNFDYSKFFNVKSKTVQVYEKA
jgi:hypothetical protein